MQHKHKLTLAIIQELALKSHGEIQGLVFLYQKIEKGKVGYDFVKLSEKTATSSEELTDKIHSFELENDLKIFDAKAYAEKKRYAFDLDLFDKLGVQNLKNKYYQKNDKVQKDVGLELQNFSDAIVPLSPTKRTIFSIGYEGISIDAYLNKLIANGIKLLCDVRANAYSNKFGFSKKELKYCLEVCGIKYEHIPALGITSNKREESGIYINTLNKDHYYRKLFEEYSNLLPTKKQFIDLLHNFLNKYHRVAITCFEADILCCHRSRLIKYLKEEFGVEGKEL